MYPGFLTNFPTQFKPGQYIGLDLGGTNFRVLLMTIDESGQRTFVSERYVIPTEKATSTQEELFDFLAEKIDEFRQQHCIRNNRTIPIGFTFSWACDKTGLTDAKLCRWSKEVTASGAIGRDVREMLVEAFERRGGMEHLDVVAIINDSIGTLAACAAEHPGCKMAIIMGTGNNIGYIEQNLEDIPNFGPVGHKSPMAVNTEVSSVSTEHPALFEQYYSKYDDTIDMMSSDRGLSRLGKLLFSMLFGEMLRFILLDLQQKVPGFMTVHQTLLNSANSIPGSLVVQMADMETIARGRNILGTVFTSPLTDTYVVTIQRVSAIICERAALLQAAGNAATAYRIAKIWPGQTLEEPFDIVCGVDGSTYTKSSFMQRRLNHWTKKLLDGTNIHIRYEEVNDGSGIGAAIVAASEYSSNLVP